MNSAVPDCQVVEFMVILTKKEAFPEQSLIPSLRGSRKSLFSFDTQLT